MPETTNSNMPEEAGSSRIQNLVRDIEIRHQGRGSQIIIYFGKMLRMFLYQNDWKLLPMSALIAGLLGMVTRRQMFLTMEGTLMGSFALACVCIWNGCFNSIQVVCRERDVIKREHRSGMHISSYIVSHMMYQALICILQTVVTLYVTLMTGVQYPHEGFITPFLMVDFGISLFLITYASDMLSLWVSSLSHSSTTAMTIMPFVLIFQLVFSGGMLKIPVWAEPLTGYTISNPGLKVIAALSDVNNRPFVTISQMMDRMQDNEIHYTLSLRMLVDELDQVENEDLDKVLDAVWAVPNVDQYLDKEYEVNTTVGQVLDIIGKDDAKRLIEENASKASYVADYEASPDNIYGYWLKLCAFVFVFSLLAMITLEFIDKDKR